MDKKTFIGLIRVSSKKQGNSGLGLSSQKNSIEHYVQSIGGTLAEIITEVESAGNKDKISVSNHFSIDTLLRKRPQLLYVIKQAQQHEYIIVVKEASRLSRFSLLIDFLLSSNISFVCSDSPNDTPFIIKLRTNLNEDELLKVSQRTSLALQQKKKRDKVTLGNPQNLTKSAIKKAT